MWTSRMVSVSALLLLLGACAGPESAGTADDDDNSTSSNGKSTTGSSGQNTNSGSGNEQSSQLGTDGTTQTEGISGQVGGEGQGGSGSVTTGTVGESGTGLTGSQVPAAAGGATTGTGEGTAGFGATGNTTITPSAGSSGTAAAGSSAGTASPEQGTGGTPEGCMDFESSAQAVPPVIEFQLDASSSMSQSTPSTNGASKWQRLQEAFRTALPQLPSEWVVGLAFYDRPGQCYQRVQAVPFAPLDQAQLQAIDTAVAQKTTGIWTPTEAAWRFAAEQVYNFSAPGYEQSPRYVVLMTDGVPTVGADGCVDGGGSGANHPITLAEFNSFIASVNAFTTQTGVQTFVVAVKGSEDPQGAEYDPITMLGQVAQAGGTTLFDLTKDEDFAAGLVNALGQIFQSVLTCNFTVPPPPEGVVLVDFSGTRVTYIAGNGNQYELTRAVGDDCTNGGEWYGSGQDQYGQPTEVILCPDTCDAIKNDPGAQLKVTYECITQV